MKVGIITASRTDNNGTDLQALAMQLLFKRMGYDAELIDYICPKLESGKKLFYPKTVRGFLSIPHRIFQHLSHQKFRQTFFQKSSSCYDASNLPSNDYDAIVVGSDQIWNLQLTGNDLSFFLPYKHPDQIKFSYAASLGKTDISDWERTYGLSKYLRDFRGVSIREESGIQAMAEIGIAARADLDPLLMVERDVWNRYMAPKRRKRGYVFVYAIDRMGECIRYAKEYAKAHSLDVILCGNPLRPLPGVKVRRFMGVQQWLRHIADAELIVTNSYHGLAFAVNYHKKFSILWLRNSVQTNDRLENLLKMIGVGLYEEGTICAPDWELAETRLQAKRLDAQAYIRRMLEER